MLKKLFFIYLGLQDIIVWMDIKFMQVSLASVH